MPIKKEIIYPVFLECAKYTTDIFWENVFEYLAYGKPPYGTYISKDFICCSYKKKEFSYKIEKKDSKILYTELYELFTKKLGLFSQTEKLKKRQEISNLERTTRTNWNSIRKKNVKEMLIELYVQKVKNEYNLSLTQSKHLLSVINISLMLKIISSKDIIFNHGHIQEIDGIEFKSGKVFFNKDIFDLDADIVEEETFIKHKILSETWEKYKKILHKLNNSISTISSKTIQQNKNIPKSEQENKEDPTDYENSDLEDEEVQEEINNENESDEETESEEETDKEIDDK